MKIKKSLLAIAAILSAGLGSQQGVRADVVIETFTEDYFENAVYASWLTAAQANKITYGPDAYSISATGYGSNWTYIGDRGIDGTGNTDVRVDVTLEGPAAADGLLGPIITLVDADGTRNNYAWFGQLLGNHILTLPLTSPTWVEAPGTTAGLDLAHIDHMHLQLDPGGFGTQGEYTVRWNEVGLITNVGISGDFDEDGDVDGRDFLKWQRGGSPAPGSATDLAAWQNNYGAGGSLVSFSAVPEPTSMGLLAVASISVLGLRRTRVSAA